ncbi:MAG: 2'-5' RNA ligase family protein, partial [Candidatus Saccharibacteria bacterium]|nr:2'-5' RNA ligase family protein [Candidatus Saccharibacteria bacterium]
MANPAVLRSIVKIFAVTAELELVETTWLAAFRAKYDEPYRPHITLKQPCFIEEHAVPVIKSLFDDFVGTLTISDYQIPVLFDNLVHGEFTIMLDATKHEQLDQLQVGVLQVLSGYRNFVKPKYEGYEADFHPHLTIARNLDEATRKQAVQEMPADYSIKGSIREITLGIADEIA